MDDQKTIQNNLLGELGLSDLPKDKKEELLTKMTEALLKRLFVETAEKLSEADQGTYARMIDEKANPREVENFLKSKIKNYDQLLEQAVADFKEKIKKGIA